MTEETADKTTLFAQIRPDQHKAIWEIALRKPMALEKVIQEAFDLLIANAKGELAQSSHLKEMRRLASEAIRIANDCHGGHSYTSIRSDDEGKCCEVRMQVDELRDNYLELIKRLES